MKRYGQNLISLLLAALLVFNMLPIAAFASDGVEAPAVETTVPEENAGQEPENNAPAEPIPSTEPAEETPAAMEDTPEETAVTEAPERSEEPVETSAAPAPEETPSGSEAVKTPDLPEDADSAPDLESDQDSEEVPAPEETPSASETVKTPDLPEDADSAPEQESGPEPEEAPEPEEEPTLQEQINILRETGGTGKIVLERDYEENLVIPAGTVLTLDLNGHVLAPVRPENNTDALNMITVSGKLVLQDSAGGGKLANIHNDADTRGVYVTDTGELTLERGTITGFKLKQGDGGAVYVAEHGKVNVTDGHITGNSAKRGGGVFAVSADSLNLKEEAVTGNTAAESGTEDVFPTPEMDTEETTEQTEDDTAEETPAATDSEPVLVEEHELTETEESESELLEPEELSEKTMEILSAAPALGPFRAAPTVQEPVSDDGITIEKITVRWLSKSTGKETPAGFDTLELETDSDMVGNQQFQIDFAISGKDDHEAGSVELVFPAYIWKDRYGNEPGNLTLSVPADPETGADFAWKRVGDNIVITNVRKISAATKVMIQGTFRNVTPHEMVDIDVAPGADHYTPESNLGASNDFCATINVTTPNDVTLSMTSNTIDATINTHVEAASATKSAYNTSRREYYIYHTVERARAAGIPEEFLAKLGSDVDQYSFARWYVSGSATGSQPFTMTITDTYDGTVIHYLDALHKEQQILNVSGMMLGVQGDANGNNVVSPDGRTVTATLYDGYNTYPKSAYVWTAYVQSEFPEEGDEYLICNSQTIEVTGWDDLITTTKEATATAPFMLPTIYTVVKVWDDDDNVEGRRPDSQWFNINYTDDTGYHYGGKTVNEETDWQYSWSDEGLKRKYYTSEYGYQRYLVPGSVEYDEEGKILKYSAWWYALERNEYDSDTHTWTYINKYHEQEYTRPLLPLIPENYVWMDKYTLNYTNSGRMATSDRALNILRRGDDVIVDYQVRGEGRFMAHTRDFSKPEQEVTSYGWHEVRLELEDNYGADTLGSALKNTLLFDDTLRLGDADAEIAYVRLSKPSYMQYQSYTAALPGTESGSATPYDTWGTWQYKEVPDKSKFPTESLMGFKDGVWTEYATLTFDENGAYSIEAKNGARKYGASEIDFPAGVQKVKTVITIPKTNGNRQQRIDYAGMSYSVGVRLLGESDLLQQRLNAIFAENDYGLCTLDNYAVLNVFNDAGTNVRSTTDWSRAWLHGRNYRVAVRAEKEFQLMENDTIHRELKLHSKVTVTQQSNVVTMDEYQTAVREGIIPNTESGTWYDLLPMGVEPDVSTVSLASGDKLLDVYTIKNYQDSGRTLLVVKADVASHVSYTKTSDPNPYRSDDTYPKEGYKNVQTLEFDAYYSWDMARIYGLDTARNVAAYEADENALGNVPGWQGEPDDPQRNHNQRAMNAVGNDKLLMTDLDPARPEGHTAFVYAGTVLKHEEVDFNAETQLRKFVTRDGLGSWSSGRSGSVQVTVNEGGYYTYMLYVASDSETTTRDMILVDSLESYVPNEDDDDYGDGQWHGSFVSMDLSALEAYGVEPVVYYSTVPGLDVSRANYQPENIDNQLKNSGDWSTTPPTDLSKVTAIAIDARHKTDGTDFELLPDNSFYVTVRMRAPVYDTAGEDTDPFASDREARKDPENNDHAYNNINLNCTQVDPIGGVTHAYIEHHYVRVGIVPYELTVSKLWNDAGNNDGKRPKAVVVKLLGNGQDTGKSVELNKENNWTAVFDHILQYDDDGNWITYTFQEEAVENDPTGDLSAYTASFDRQGDQVTIINTHVPETTEISFTKEWTGDDDEENRALRPDSIEVRLMADGVFTGKTVTVKPDRNEIWSGGFTDLPKYANPTGLSGDAQPISYSVEEVPVYKYLDTYTTEDDGTIKITNTFYPFGDLRVSKTVENVPDSDAKDKRFNFTLMLKDSEGEDLTEKFEYEIRDSADAKVDSGTIGNGDSFTLRGGQYLLVKDIPSESTYEVVEDKLAGFTLSGYSGTSGMIRAGATQNAGFTNRYEASGVQELSLTKTLEGRTMSRYQFRFELIDKTNGSETYDDVIRTASADAAGNAIFGRLSYSEQDHGKTFVYEIREVDRGKKGYTYDDTVYTVEVKVVDNGDGTMTCTPTYKKSDGTEINASDVKFENKYEARGSHTLKAWKQLSGGELTADQFKFELVDKDGTVLQTKRNDANGLIAWDAISFTEADVGKTYLYVAREVVETDARVVYDTSLKGYELIVADNGDGTLAITQNNVTVEPDGNGGYSKTGDTTDLPIFVNGLKPGDLSVTKLTEWEANKEPDANVEFPFTLTLVGEELPEKITVVLSENDSRQKAYSADNKPTPLTDAQKAGQEIELPIVSAENVTPMTGEYAFTLKAGQTLTVKDLPAGIAYQFQEAIPSGWTLEFENVAGVVAPKATTKATYTNTYEPGKAVATVLATKRLDGKTPAGGMFAFELVEDTEGNANQGEVLQTLWNHASGYVLFDLVYSEEDVGDHHYILREVPKLVESVDADGNITYSTDEDALRKISFDEQEYGVTVHVTKTVLDGNVTVNAQVVYDENNAPPQFQNETRPGSLQITKSGQGVTEANQDAEFTFQVTLTNPAGMPLTDAGQMFWYAEDDPNAAQPEETPTYTPETAGTGDGGGTSPAPAPARRTAKASAAKVPARVPAANNVTSYGGIDVSGMTIVKTGTMPGDGRVINNVKQGSVTWTIYSGNGKKVLILEPTNGVSGSFSNTSNVTHTPLGREFDTVTHMYVKGTCYAWGKIAMLFDPIADSGGSKLKYADLRGMDVSFVSDSMCDFFDYCKDLEYLDISTWQFTPANVPNNASSWRLLWAAGNLKVVRVGPYFNAKYGSTFFHGTQNGGNNYWTNIDTGKRVTNIYDILDGDTGNPIGTEKAGTWVRGNYNPNFNIQLMPNGATGGPNMITDAQLSDPPVLPDAGDCGFAHELNFAGWSTDPDAILPEYAAGDKFAGAALGGETITLYAIWMSEDAFLLHYDANGGYSATQWQRVNGPKDTVTMPTPIHPNSFEFLGWNTAENGSGTYYSGEVTGAEFNAEAGSTVTLYAQYLDPSKRATLTVNHYQQNPDGATYGSSPAAIDRTVHDLHTTVTPEPRTYTGFRTPAAQTVTLDGNTTIRYDYERTRYTLKFDANGGTGEMPDSAMIGGVSSKLPVSRFTKENSLFVGWNTAPDGSGTNYGDGQSVNTIAGDGETLTLYAQWYGLDDANSAEPTNGTYTVHCKAGQTIVFPNLPADTLYEVSEIDLPDGWSLVGIENASGSVLSAERVNVTATNRYSASGSANLIAHKSLPGEVIQAKQFTFQLLDSSGNVIETAFNSTADQAEEIIDDNDETVSNPWYGTAPVRFGTISFTEQGVYHYTIRELPGSDAAVVYDTHEEQVTVLVKDRGDGYLTTEVFYDADEAGFVNTMSSGNLTVSKTLRNATAAAAESEFQFTVYLYDSTGTEIGEEYPVTMPDGSTGSIESGGYISIKGGQSFTITGLPHKCGYLVVETPAPGFTQVAADNTRGTIHAGETEQVSFENAYSVSKSGEGGVEIRAEKKFLGGDIQEGQFVFRLTDDQGEMIEEVSAQEDGSVVFTPLRYGLEDDGKRFVYYIEEIPGEEQDIVYDEHKEQVAVTVLDRGDGTMETAIEYDEDGAVFTNVNMRRGNLTVSKTLRNATAAAAESEFQFTVYLYDSTGTEIGEEYPVTMPDGSTGSIESGGYISIKGGQSFTITGLPHKCGYLVVETPAPGFTQVAADNTRGTIYAGETEQVSFENAYSVSKSGEGSAEIRAEKKFLGGDIQEGQFVFRLTDDQGEMIEEVSAQEDGSVVFTPLRYGLEDDGKRFVYYIEEIPGEEQDIVYDEHKEQVAVTVLDRGDGTMETAIEYDEDGAVFTNVKMFEFTVEKSVVGDRDYYDGELFDFTISLMRSGESYAIDNVPVGASDWSEVRVGTYSFRLADGDSFQLDLPEGVQYTVVESVPEGYAVRSEVTGSSGESAASGDAEITGEIQRQFESERLLIVNEKLVHYDITLKKTDGKSEEPLEGAVFDLYGADLMNEEQNTDDTVTPLMEHITTDQDGSADLGSLYMGTYYLVETEAPKDYALLEEPIPLTVTDEGIMMNNVLIVPESEDPRAVEVTITNDYLYGSLEIVKDLPAFEDSEEATFVFDIYAEQDGQTVYSNVAALTFTAAGEKKVLLERIPAGAKVTVTEIYSGAHYTAEIPQRETTIQSSEISSVSFSNSYNGNKRGGHGVVNHFAYDSEAGWQWNKLRSNG